MREEGVDRAEVARHYESVEGRFRNRSETKHLVAVDREREGLKIELADLKALRLQANDMLLEQEAKDAFNVQWWGYYMEDIQDKAERVKRRLAKLDELEAATKRRSVTPLECAPPETSGTTGEEVKVERVGTYIQLDAVRLLIRHLTDRSWLMRACGAYGLARLSQIGGNRQVLLKLDVIRKLSVMMHDAQGGKMPTMDLIRGLGGTTKGLEGTSEGLSTAASFKSLARNTSGKINAKIQRMNSGKLGSNSFRLRKSVEPTP
eukprot:7000792-Pyramimonas_sp.AAC.1